MSTPITPVLLFVNKKSGGGLGGQLIEAVSSNQDVHVVQLPEMASTWPEVFADLVHNPNLRIIAAGGDGTVNWTITLLTKFYGSDENSNRPPLGVIPLGTGNDMSRALKWGGGMTAKGLSDLPQIIQVVQSTTHRENLDVWSVTVTPKDKSIEPSVIQMLNYFSIGVDADMAVEFENTRQGDLGKVFTSQAMSKFMYFPVGVKRLFMERAISDYCQGSFQTGTENVVLNFSKLDKTIVFQAISSIYGGQDLWTDKSTRRMDDQKFEVIVHGGVFHLGMQQIGIQTGKPIGQGKSAHITVTDQCCYQVDGEGRLVEGPTDFDLVRTGSYPFLFGE